MVATVHSYAYSWPKWKCGTYCITRQQLAWLLIYIATYVYIHSQNYNFTISHFTPVISQDFMIHVRVIQLRSYTNSYKTYNSQLFLAKYSYTAMYNSLNNFLYIVIITIQYSQLAMRESYICKYTIQLAMFIKYKNSLTS